MAAWERERNHIDYPCIISLSFHRLVIISSWCFSLTSVKCNGWTQSQVHRDRQKDATIASLVSFFFSTHSVCIDSRSLVHRPCRCHCFAAVYSHALSSFSSSPCAAVFAVINVLINESSHPCQCMHVFPCDHLVQWKSTQSSCTLCMSDLHSHSLFFLFSWYCIVCFVLLQLCHQLLVEQ